MDPSSSASLETAEQRLRSLRALQAQQNRESPQMPPETQAADPLDEQITFLVRKIQIGKINSKYADLDNISFNMRKVTMDFDDDKLKGEKGITMVQLLPEQIIELGRSVIPMIASGFSRQGAAALFVLAYNTLAPGGKGNLFGSISDLENIGDKLYSDFSISPLYEGLFSESPGNGAALFTMSPGNSAVVEAALYPYLASTMMRLFTKSPENYVNAWNQHHVHNAFAKFYGYSINFNLPTPNEQAMKSLSNWFSFEPLAKQTLYRILYLSNSSETFLGFKQFLFETHLAYTGMHLARFFVNLCKCLNCTYEVMLQVIYLPFYKREIDCLRGLVKILTTNNAQNAKGMWKYGRIFDETFMADIQTKSCPKLVYIFGEALKMEDPKSYENFDKIAQLRNISETDKKHAKAVAQKLISTIRAKSSC